MAIPDFSTPTKDLLAKRARYQCSNPDCNVHTVGPNTSAEKATSIGEAAHIMGAKPGSARYDDTMTDVSRANSANGIWLCGNCHRRVDRDPKKYSAQLLFRWRNEHEALAARELGTRGERIRYDSEMEHLRFLSTYPPIIQRIAFDEQVGWEWLFIAELSKHLNTPQFKRLNDLREGYYFNPQPRVDEDTFLGWAQHQTYVMVRILEVLSPLLERLSASWGAPGEAGVVEEMHDVCVLLRDALSTIVDLEETLSFANIPESGEPIRAVLKDVLGTNAEELKELPDRLYEIAALANTDHEGTEDDPLMLEWEIQFTTPDDMVDRFNAALEQYRRYMSE